MHILAVECKSKFIIEYEKTWGMTVLPAGIDRVSSNIEYFSQEDIF